MTLRPAHALLFAVLTSTFTFPAWADGEPLSVRILPPERLATGDHTEVVVEVDVSACEGQPLILTPTSEGDAIEVVRGRFLREDGVLSEHTLRFRVPIVAASAGNSVFRVRVTSYVCRTRCRAVEGDAFVVLRAAPRSNP